MLEWLIPQEQMDALRTIINENEKFVVVAHKNPDGDAVGSSLAMMLYLRSIGKTADVVLPNNYPEFLAWLPAASEMVVYETAEERARELVAAADVIFASISIPYPAWVFWVMPWLRHRRPRCL